MSDTYTQQEICDAAKMIRDYCRAADCNQCIFYNESNDLCSLTSKTTPASWRDFTKPRWTAADSTLAKALIMMGYATATKTMRSDDGHTSITVIKLDADGRKLYVDEITQDSFPALEYDETIKLEDIAGEETSAND